jgi:hypothetical protein
MQTAVKTKKGSIKEYVDALLDNLSDAMKLVTELNGCVAALEEEVEAHKAIDDHDKLYRMAALMGCTQDLDEALKLTQQRIHALNQDISTKHLLRGMQDLLSKGFTLGTRKFDVKTRTTASFTDKPEGFKWLRDIGEGALITETVHSQTLSAFIKGWIEDNALTPPDFVKVNNMQYVKLS